MKYHKIRNVELTTCTAEQMIAYNFAHMLRGDRFYKEYRIKELLKTKRSENNENI